MAGIQTATKATRRSTTRTVANAKGTPRFDPVQEPGYEGGEAKGGLDTDGEANKRESHVMPDDERAGAVAPGALLHSVHFGFGDTSHA